MNVSTLDNFITNLSLDFISHCSVLSMMYTHSLMNKSQIKIPVKLDILKLSINFFTIHSDNNSLNNRNKSIVKCLESDSISNDIIFFHEIVTLYEFNFIVNLKFETIIDLFIFSDYIDFIELRKLTARKIAFEIKQCKSVKEIRNFFEIENDFDRVTYERLIEESNCLHTKIALE